MAGMRFAVVPAAYVYLRRGDQVLLQRRRNTGYMDGMWCAGAAGHIEPGETAHDAAAREAAEELGVVLDVGSVEPLTIMQRTDGTFNPIEQRADWFFTGSAWRGEPAVMEPTACSAVAWFSLTSLPSQMPDHERMVLDALARGAPPLFTSFGFR